MKRNYQQVHGKKSIGLKYILTIYIINQINLYEKNLAILIVTFFILQTQAFFFKHEKKTIRDTMSGQQYDIMSDVRMYFIGGS